MGIALAAVGGVVIGALLFGVGIVTGNAWLILLGLIVLPVALVLGLVKSSASVAMARPPSTESAEHEWRGGASDKNEERKGSEGSSA